MVGGVVVVAASGRIFARAVSSKLEAISPWRTLENVSTGDDDEEVGQGSLGTTELVVGCCGVCACL